MLKNSHRHVVSGSRRNRAGRRLRVEALEDRRVLATFSVTSTNDAGEGTLRQAIEVVNAHPGPDEITFALPHLAPGVIELLSPLPVISDPVKINGGGTVALNGSLAGNADGFVIVADDTEIRGLSITGFAGHGIAVHSPYVSDLATVDAMVSGSLPSESFTGTIEQADLYDGFTWFENWFYNNPIPGGGGDDYGIVATGALNVTTPGLYSFAISNDDGARLRIDGADVIVDDALHGFENRFGSAELTAGLHSFEWVGFERGFDAGFELSVAVGEVDFEDVSYPLYYQDVDWKVVGDPFPAAEIALDGTIDVTAYYFTSHHVRNVVVANNSITNNSLDGVNVQQPLGVPVDSLADVDEMVSGAQPSESFTGTIEQADLYDGFTWFENWFYDNPIPGGGGDDYAIVATGGLNVTTPGLYSFAVSNDDGARLRIDGADVIVDDALHGFENRFGSAELTAGLHSFEWVGFERGFDAGFELSVAVGEVDFEDVSYPLYYQDVDWKVVGDPFPAAEIALDGTIDVTAYYPTSDPDNLRIQSNVITGNIGSGLYLWQLQGSEIHSNLLSLNGASGALLEQSAGNDLKGNTSEGNGYAGLFLNGSHGNHLKGNTADGNFIGIWLTSSHRNSFKGNSASNGNIGFGTEQSNDNTLKDNTASHNFMGFSVGSFGDSNNLRNTFTGNVASENHHGFNLRLSRDSTYRGNTAIDNSGYGFTLVGGAFNELHGNSAVRNSSGGFQLIVSSNNHLRGNVARSNGGSGFELLVSSDNNTLTGNSAVENTGSGFSVVDSFFNELSRNTSRGNGGNGFSLQSANSNTLTRNGAVENEGYGIFVFEEDVLDNIFECNELEDNLLGDVNFPL